MTVAELTGITPEGRREVMARAAQLGRKPPGGRTAAVVVVVPTNLPFGLGRMDGWPE